MYRWCLGSTHNHKIRYWTGTPKLSKSSDLRPSVDFWCAFQNRLIYVNDFCCHLNGVHMPSFLFTSSPPLIAGAVAAVTLRPSASVLLIYQTLALLIMSVSRAFARSPTLRCSCVVPRASSAAATARPSSSPYGSPGVRGRCAQPLWWRHNQHYWTATRARWHARERSMDLRRYLASSSVLLGELCARSPASIYRSSQWDPPCRHGELRRASSLLPNGSLEW